MDTVDFYLNALKTLKDRKEEGVLKRKLWNDTHYGCCNNLILEGHSIQCIKADEELGFKNRFIQYYPAYIEVDLTDYATLNFNTIDELLNFECVSRWKNGDNFYRFSVFPVKADFAAFLIVEYNVGKQWWTIGKIKTLDGLDLPIQTSIDETK